MAFLSSKTSLKNKPAHNFSQKITQPSSSVIICSSDFIEFLSSLWGLGILIRYYFEPFIILFDKKWEVYIKNLYPERDFTCLTIPELAHNKDIAHAELIVFLTNTLQKDVRSALKKIPDAVIAGTSNFGNIHTLNCIISVNDLQSYYYQFFSFALQLAGVSEDWDDYTAHSHFMLDTSNIPQKFGMICIDISPGVYDTRFTKRHICQLVEGLQKSFPIEILLIDKNEQYYEKLFAKKFKNKPELLVINDYEKAYEHLKAARLLIAPNTSMMHYMQYTDMPTYCVMVLHERRCLSRSSKNRIHVVQRFAELKAKDILPDIKELLQ